MCQTGLSYLTNSVNIVLLFTPCNTYRKKKDPNLDIKNKKWQTLVTESAALVLPLTSSQKSLAVVYWFTVFNIEQQKNVSLH